MRQNAMVSEASDIGYSAGISMSLSRESESRHGSLVSPVYPVSPLLFRIFYCIGCVRAVDELHVASPFLPVKNPIPYKSQVIGRSQKKTEIDIFF